MKTLFTIMLSGITFLLTFLFGPNEMREEIKKNPIITEHNYANQLKIDTPDQSRFVKVNLLHGQFFEPTEMAILPNLDILVAQRRGEIMLYKQQTKSLKEAIKLDVYFKTNTP